MIGFFFPDKYFGRAIIEVKQSLSNPMVVDQAVSQTIVFSFIQEKEYPSAHSFVPNILISRDEFRVIMYDATNDILICSQPLYIFEETSLNESSIIILWMVLHYRVFLKKKEADTRLNNCKASFNSTNLYCNKSELKFGKEYFPVVEKDSLPSLETLSVSKDVFQTA